jgi:phenylalanyl-tRNA synthetase alpha chain
MDDSLEALQGEVLDRIQRSESEKDLEQIRVETLGLSGRVTPLLRGMKDLPAEERPRRGEELNRLRNLLQTNLDERLSAVREQAKARALEEDRVDVTLPGTRWARGSTHPLTLVIDEIIDIFLGMGFEIARGPDIEDD